MGRQKKDARRPAGALGARPIVAIVGRPNVGKSTLFNKLAGANMAIVEDKPGVTRDRHYADAWAVGRQYVLIDTGGFDPDSDDPMTSGIAQHVKMALQECDLVICVLDSRAEPLPADRETVQLLRGADKPVIYIANKADSPTQEQMVASLYELGVDHIIAVSALHGRGLGELEETIASHLPKQKEAEAIDLNLPKVAIVGRPNAGKSSMINRLSGEDRQLVDDRPGTTVDSVDTLIERGEHRMVLIDTAGIRRKRNVGKKGIEALSVYQAIRAIERSHVAVIMIDAKAGVGEQDAKIAGLADDRGRALVLALNKVDLMSKSEQKEAMDQTRRILAFIPWASMITVSALDGKGVNALLSRASDASKEHNKRISTGELNRFFEEVLEKHPPPSMGNRPVRFYYITQAMTAPPTFVVMTNEPKNVHFSYQRYVVNQIRKRFGFQGTPIRVRYRGK